MSSSSIPIQKIIPSSSRPCHASEWRKPILEEVMEALAEPNTHLIGVYGSDDAIKEDLLEKVDRRVQRDKMFGMVVRASITNLGKIQENIASQLGHTFNDKSKDKRAMELIHRIKNEQSILIVLSDVDKGFELSKVGIPYGADHRGCKVLLTSTSEDVLSNHIHTQKNFKPEVWIPQNFTPGTPIPQNFKPGTPIPRP